MSDVRTYSDGEDRCRQLGKRLQEKLDAFKADKPDLGKVCGHSTVLFFNFSIINYYTIILLFIIMHTVLCIEMKQRFNNLNIMCWTSSVLS